MIGRTIGYIMTIGGTAGYLLKNDPDIKYPALLVAIIGAIVIIEATVSQIVKVIRKEED